MTRFSVSVALILLLGATGAYSDDQTHNQINPPNSQNPKEISDSIVVTADRYASPFDRIASAVTVITGEQILLSQVNTVSELLRSVPGLDVVSYGPEGQTTAIFLRGANSHHTLVMVDGVKVNDPSSPNGAYDFANLTVDNIQRVEILRGPQSVLYGSDAIGGVIQLFTKRGHGKPSLKATAETGSKKSSSGGLEISGGTDRIDYSLTASRLHTDGYSSSAARLGGREDDGFDNTDLFLQSGIQLGSGYEVTLIGRYNESDVDFDQGYGLLDDPNIATNTKTRLLGIRLEDHASGRFWEKQIAISYNDRDSRTIDEVDADHPDDSQNSRYQGNRLKIDWQNVLAVSENTKVVLGVESEREEFSSGLLFYSIYGPYADTTSKESARATGIYGMARRTIGDNLSVSLGFRSDHHEEFGSVSTWRGTAIYSFPSINLKIKGAAGTGFKSPSLYQLYNKQYGNTDLQPEESESWEIGFEQIFDPVGISFGSTYFQNKYENLIATDNVTSLVYNIDKAGSKGVESFAELRKERYSLRLDHTYTKSEDKTTGKELIRRPGHKISAHLTAVLSVKLKTAVSFKAVGKRTDLNFATSYGDEVTLKAYQLVNLMAAYQLSSTIELFGRVENIFDTGYEEVFGYGAAPLSVHVGARINIL